MRKNRFIKIIIVSTFFCLGLFIFLIPTTSQAQGSSQGCCEKVLKTTLQFEVEDMSEEDCNALAEENEKQPEEERRYENVTYRENKIAFFGRCRSEDEIDKNSTLPKFTPPELNVSIPGLIKFTQPNFCPDSDDTTICINWIGQYIAALISYLITIVGIVAAIVLMVGGIRWLTAAGNSQAVGGAKKIIINSLLGLALTLCSYVLLVIINPNLVSLTPLRITWLEGLSLRNLKKSGGDCNNGQCTEIDEAINNNSEGISGAILKSIMDGGESCDPAVSKDGHSSCGYCQAVPETRIETCGLKGTAADCELFEKDIQADINCAAKVLMEMAPRCGNFEDINKTARCYNTGGLKKCGTDNYCERVEDYFNNKCGTTNNQTTPPNNP